MTEWLNQYEKVAQRQQQYLQKIRDLRHRLQTKDERYMMLSIERMRNVPRDSDSIPHHKSPDFKSHVPWSSSLLAHSFYPKMSTPSPRLTMDNHEVSSSGRGSGSYGCVIEGERLLPKQHPKHLSPINSRHKKDKGEKFSKSDITLERNKTDYEPIEDIAKRNRIQFSRYLASRDDKDEREKKWKGVKGGGGGDGGGGCRDSSRRLSLVANAGDGTPRDV